MLSYIKNEIKKNDNSIEFCSYDLKTYAADVCMLSVDTVFKLNPGQFDVNNLIILSFGCYRIIKTYLKPLGNFELTKRIWNKYLKRVQEEASYGNRMLINWINMNKTIQYRNRVKYPWALSNIIN